MTDASSAAAQSGLHGTASGAYIWWGLCPGFFPLLLPAGSLEVLAHRDRLERCAAGRWCSSSCTPARGPAPAHQAHLAAAGGGVRADLVNWGIYIYAATHGHVVDAALGYFINPLVTVALGVLIFRERIGRWQLVGLALAPWRSSVLDRGGGCAAVHRADARRVVRAVRPGEEGGRRRSAGQRRGRALLALPLAGGYLIALQVLGHGHFVGSGAGHAVLLMLAGPVTAIPLLLFAAAAQRLPLITMGLLFYLNPGLQMAWGVLVGHEPMPLGRWVGFALIWVALVVLTIGSLRRQSPTHRCDQMSIRRSPIVITVTSSNRACDDTRRTTPCATAC